MEKEDIVKLLISETDTLWEDISDDGDGDYDKETIILTNDGEKVVNLIMNIMQNNFKCE